MLLDEEGEVLKNYRKHWWANAIRQSMMQWKILTTNKPRTLYTKI